MLYNLRSNRCYTLAGTEYCLTEYEYGVSFDHMLRTTKWLVAAGYIPIIAHAERCDCIGKRPELLSELREGGSLIQINADAVIGKADFYPKTLFHVRNISKMHVIPFGRIFTAAL